MNYALTQNSIGYAFYLGDIDGWKLSWSKLLNRAFIEIIEPLEVIKENDILDLNELWVQTPTQSYEFLWPMRRVQP